MRLLIEADGGSRGNPGPSGFGAVIKDDTTGEVLQEIAEAIGVTTNNVAEYRGLIAGLKAAKAYAPEHVNVRMDSKLVIEQSAGRWKVKTPHIQPLLDEVRAAVRELGVKVTFAHIPRALNSHADRLANQAMDGAGTAAVEAPVAWTDPEPPSDKKLPGWQRQKEAATTTVLLRHGESTLSIDRRFNGTSNPPLTELGERQARAAAQRLAASRKEVITTVISSPLLRATTTAALAADALGVPLVVDEGFQETYFGAWEGLTYSEVMAAYGAELRAWHSDITVKPGGDGESFAETEARVKAARRRICKDYDGQTVLIVCHVTPIKVMTWDALRTNEEVLFRTGLDLASITEIDWYDNGASVLRRFNDAAHLEPGWESR